jgi:2-succinyl-5-enolpyruvyl-6-hydroxy-3-cyclohexene-1-carboxylate synthase
MLSHGSIQTLTAGLVIIELLRVGVEHFIVSPGARAIPFVLALNSLSKRNPIEERKPKITLLNDERAACFFAQGISKSGSLSCLICTSGTAVANYLPGVIEAFYSNTPLIIISTDRPWELQNARANQTINQTDIFSNFISRKIELSAPEKNVYPHSLLTNVDTIVHYSKSTSSPVHINIAFRKPFYDAGFNIGSDIPEEELAIMTSWLDSKRPYLEIHPHQKKYSLDLTLTAYPQSDRNIVFILGPMQDKELISLIAEVGDNLGIPIFADIHSNARSKTYPAVFSLFNFYIESLSTTPDEVFYFGDRIISDPLARFLGKMNCPITQVTNHLERSDAIENEFIPVKRKIDLPSFFNDMVPTLSKSSGSFLTEVRGKELECHKKLESILPGEDSSERSLLWQLPSFIPEDTDIFLSASLIFREADCYSRNFPDGVTLYSNRGATGIDGILSSSLGVALGGQKPLLCILGDQATLHDLNSLALLQHIKKPVVILIVNNNGGAIFNLMKNDSLEETLVNPHSIDFQKFSEGFKLEYLSANSVKTISEIVPSILGSEDKKLVLEFTVDGRESADQLYSIQKNTRQYVTRVALV